MISKDNIIYISQGNDYGGKYVGKPGKAQSFTEDKVGVEFADEKNPASSRGLFWFDKNSVKPIAAIPNFDTPKRNDAIIPANLAKEFINAVDHLNFVFGAPRKSLDVKRVIFSGPKTIVFWSDGAKTIASCGEGDTNDPYAGFCAAVTKRVFGSTSQAKKVLARTGKESDK